MPERIVIADTECEVTYRVRRSHGVENGIPLILWDADLRTGAIDVLLRYLPRHSIRLLFIRHYLRNAQSFVPRVGYIGGGLAARMAQRIAHSL
jgi:hypothetical protein